MARLRFNAVRAPTLDALTKKVGFDPGVLRDSVNRSARGESENPFEKWTEEMAPIETCPFYAIDASIDSRLPPMATMTVGGLRSRKPAAGRRSACVRTSTSAAVLCGLRVLRAPCRAPCRRCAAVTHRLKP